MRRIKRILVPLLLIAALTFSFFILKPVLSAPGFWSGEIRFLNEKKDNVLKLVAASSAASAVITLIPDDVGTPIADKLADLTTGFMIVLAVVIAEKYLLTLLGGITAWLLIPATCIIGIFHYFRPDWLYLRNIIIKLVILSIAFLTFIPAGIWASSTIESTFESSINESINTAMSSAESLDIGEPENRNVWQKITGVVSDAFDYVGKAVDNAKTVLSNFIEAVAIMLITNCVIPLLVLLMYVLLIKRLFGLNFSLQEMLSKGQDRSKKKRLGKWQDPHQ